MIIPSHSFGVVASGRPRASAGSSVTPSPALNWTPLLGCDTVSTSQDYTEERIQGISENIILAFSVSARSAQEPEVYYRLSATPMSSDPYYVADLNFSGSYSAPLPEGRVDLSGGGFNYWYDPSSNLFLQPSSGTYLAGSTLSVPPNYYLSFVCYGWSNIGQTVTIEIRNQSDGNALIDTIEFKQLGG